MLGPPPGTPPLAHTLSVWCSAAGGGLSSATLTDLQELRALLVEAKSESEQLRAERDEVRGRYSTVGHSGRVSWSPALLTAMRGQRSSVGVLLP